jgi:hypothetical protein
MAARRRALGALCIASIIGLAVTSAAGCGGSDGAEPAPSQSATPPAPAGSSPSPGPGAAPAEPAPPSERPAVRVSFKLDPALTAGVYLGERWVSPPVFQALPQGGDAFHVEARAEAPGLSGAPVTWTASDAGAVAVAPADSPQVKITISRPGRVALTVRVGAESTTLDIEAAQASGLWQVTFSE